MSVTSNLRKYLKSNPEIAKFLMPGTKNEILLDLNGKDGLCVYGHHGQRNARDLRPRQDRQR